MNLYGFSREKLLCIGIVVILLIVVAVMYGRQTVEHFGERRQYPHAPFERRPPSWTRIEPSPPIMPTSPDGSILLP